MAGNCSDERLPDPVRTVFFPESVGNCLLYLHSVFPDRLVVSERKPVNCKRSSKSWRCGKGLEKMGGGLSRGVQCEPPPVGHTVSAHCHTSAACACQDRVERADDMKAKLTLEKLDEEEAKRQIQQEMMACKQQQEEQQKDFSQTVNKVQNEIKSLDKRKQELLAKRKRCQDALEAESAASSRLKQKFKICVHIPDTKVNFTAQHKEAENNQHVVTGVFTVTQRVCVPLKAGQALVTFKEDKVASQVLKLACCSISLENSSVDVTPVTITMDPAVKFEVHLSVSQKELKVSGVPPSMSEDRVELSFSKPSRGGGEVERVKYDRTTAAGTITFVHPGVAERLALRGTYQVNLDPEVRVQVGHVYHYQLRKFQTFCGSAKRTVLLDGMKVDDMDDEEDLQDHLEIHFQKPSNGGEIESIKYTSSQKGLQAFFCDDVTNTGN